MALAKPGFCYFSIPIRLKVSNMELGHSDILVVMGENVAANSGFILELKPNSPVHIPLTDAHAMIAHYGMGFIDDRERPDTPEAEAARKVLKDVRERFSTVLDHPAVSGKPAHHRWALDLLNHTEKSAWEICRILMKNRPVLVKSE